MAPHGGSRAGNSLMKGDERSLLDLDDTFASDCCFRQKRNESHLCSTVALEAIHCALKFYKRST